MMSGNTFPEPQPDSASYADMENDISVPSAACVNI